jgi:hypothetical protein
MKKQRSIGLAIVFTILTFGIYGIYWYISLTNEVSRLSNEPNFSGAKAFLLSIITCGIYSFFWVYQLGKNIAKAQGLQGKRVTDNATLFVVLTFFSLGIVAFSIAQSDVNQLD